MGRPASPSRVRDPSHAARDFAIRADAVEQVMALLVEFEPLPVAKPDAGAALRPPTPSNA